MVTSQKVNLSFVKKISMNSFDLCSVDIIATIASHLSQRDIASWSLSSKMCSQNVYPKSITHRFPVDASQAAYENFVQYVSKRKIRTLKVYVNPLIWNDVASRGIGKQRFDTVTVLPNHPDMYAYTYDETSWIPECTNFVRGFASKTESIHIDARIDRLFLWTDQDSRPPLPYMDPDVGIDTVACIGQFSRYDNIWAMPHVCMRMATITQDMLDHLARCRCVALETCDFDDCRPVTFDADSITIGLDAFPFVYDAPNCTEIVIKTNGPLTDLYKHTRRHFQKNMYPRVQHVSIHGYLHEVDFEQFSAFLRGIFPPGVVFLFLVRLVNS
jgi:hypothetical protein